MSRFHNFAANTAKVNTAQRFFETVLRSVLMNESIQINLGLQILRSSFLHWGYPWRNDREIEKSLQSERWGCGCRGHGSELATDRHPETITKRSQIVFAITSIALSLEPSESEPNCWGFPCGL